VLYSKCDDRVTRACVERGCGVGVGEVSGWVTSGVTPCIMRRGGSLFCVVAPLSPLSHPAVAVGKSPPDSLSSSPLLWGVAQVTERSFSSRFRGKLRGINGSSTEQKPVEACERALAPPLRTFYRTSPLRAFRGGSSRRDREDISPETGFLRLLFFFNGRTSRSSRFRSCEIQSRVYSRSSLSISFPN